MFFLFDSAFFVHILLEKKIKPSFIDIMFIKDTATYSDPIYCQISVAKHLQ